MDYVSRLAPHELWRCISSPCIEPRTYRHWVKDKDLVSFNVVVKETDLYIRARTNLKRKAHKLVLKYREMLERYIERHPSFLTSLEPIAVGDDAPRIVTEMAEAARKVGGRSYGGSSRGDS